MNTKADDVMTHRNRNALNTKRLSQVTGVLLDEEEGEEEEKSEASWDCCWTVLVKSHSYEKKKLRIEEKRRWTRRRYGESFL